MAEPLLAALAAEGGSTLTVAALALGRAGVPCDAAGSRDRRAAVRARSARLVGPAPHRRHAARPLRRWPTCCPTRSSRRLLPWLASIPHFASATRAKEPLAAAQPSACRTRRGGRRWSRSTGPLAGAGFDGASASVAAPRRWRDGRRRPAPVPGLDTRGATGPSRRAPSTDRPSAGRRSTTRPSPDRCMQADGTSVVLLGSKGDMPRCANRHRRRRARCLRRARRQDAR